MPIFYTPKQANDLLPDVSAIVKEIVVRKRDADGAKGLQLEHAVTKLQEAIGRLEELGVVLKDPEIGLVDFPAVRLGKRVYLCWKMGETEVTHWHGLDEGYAGRKPIDNREFYEEDVAFQSIDR